MQYALKTVQKTGMLTMKTMYFCARICLFNAFYVICKPCRFPSFVYLICNCELFWVLIENLVFCQAE